MQCLVISILTIIFLSLIWRRTVPITFSLNGSINYFYTSQKSHQAYECMYKCLITWYFITGV